MNSAEETRWQAQTARIKECLDGLLGSDKYRVHFVHLDGEITFRVEGVDGLILTEDLRGTMVSEIEAMSNDELKGRLQAMLSANLSRSRESI